MVGATVQYAELGRLNSFLAYSSNPISSTNGVNTEKQLVS
jgi:hypothetical protein